MTMMSDSDIADKLGDNIALEVMCFFYNFNFNFKMYIKLIICVCSMFAIHHSLDSSYMHLKKVAVVLLVTPEGK
jgi:hypothetical protein